MFQFQAMPNLIKSKLKTFSTNLTNLNSKNENNNQKITPPLPNHGTNSQNFHGYHRKPNEIPRVPPPVPQHGIHARLRTHLPPKSVVEPKKVGCLVIGDPNVGKTTMIKSYTTGEYLDSYSPTVYDEFKGLNQSF